MSDTRVHRPPMERTGPIRDFANILGRAGTFSDSRDDRDRRETSADGGHRDGRPEDAPRGDFVTEGVRTAYQVIEAYLRQGQQVAQELGRFTYGRAFPDAGPDVSARTTRLLADLTANWFDLLGIFSEAMRPMVTPVTDGARPARPPGSASDTGTSAGRLVFEIVSSRPALPQAEFHPGRETLDLATHGLRCLGSDAGEIPVTFAAEPDAGRVVARIEVPADQQPGLYTGTLLSASGGDTVGSLSLRIR